MRNMAVLHSPAFSYPLPVLVRVLSNLLIFKGKILYYNKDSENIQEPIFTPDYLKFIAIPDRIFHLSFKAFSFLYPMHFCVQHTDLLLPPTGWRTLFFFFEQTYEMAGRLKT